MEAVFVLSAIGLPCVIFLIFRLRKFPYHHNHN